MQHLEKEIKVKISDENKLVAIIEKLKLEFVNEYEQIDSYFDFPTNDLFLKDEVLRIREENGKYYLVYKGKREETEGKIRREIAVEISDPLAMEKILSKLNLRKTLVIKKKRKEFAKDQIKLYLDNVDNLGTFVEIEADEKLDINALIKMLNEIGMSKDSIIKETYSELMLLKT
jgi:adenylyl cyclase CyaB, putative